jgi:hypothetical protein
MKDTGVDLEGEIGAAIDEALEKLRWCRLHLEDNRASHTLRDIETRLGYLSLALNWQMDGEVQQAETALRMARGGVRKPPEPIWSDDFWFAH